MHGATDAYFMAASGFLERPVYARVNCRELGSGSWIVNLTCRPSSSKATMARPDHLQSFSNN
jgi:hypothetical protein